MNAIAETLRTILNDSGLPAFASADALSQALAGHEVPPLTRNLLMRCAEYSLFPTARFDTPTQANRYSRLTADKLELEHGVRNDAARELAVALATAFASDEAAASVATAQQRPAGIKLRSGVVSAPGAQPTPPPPAPTPEPAKKEKKGLFSFFSKKK